MATMNHSKTLQQLQQQRQQHQPPLAIDFSSLTSDEDWLLNAETPGSSTSSLFETCRCCGRQDCESLEIFNRAMKKLESDTRLAAEIGQGLLHKHDNYVLDATQKQNQLEKQLQKCHERVSELEQSLDETENARDRMENEKNKWSWEYQKRQKIMDETLADLEIVNDKCNQLTKEVESKNGEIEKLRIFKFMVRQSEIREETLRSKLDDTNQELAVCRKNELILESKNKKLKMRYESLYTNYENLLKEISDKEGLAASLLSNVPGKVKSAQQPVPMQDVNNDDLIGLIKEISSSNYKLKSEILQYKEQLEESRSEVIALTQKLDERMDDTPSLEDDVKSKRRALTLPQKSNRTTTSASATTTTTTTTTTPPVVAKTQKSMSTTTASRRNMSVRENTQGATKKTTSKTKPIEIQRKTDILPTPTMSTSMPTASSGSPVVHHHYHYYLKNKENKALLEEKNENDHENESNKSDISSNNDSLEFGDDSKKLTDSIVLSPSSSVSTFKPASAARSPFVILLEHVTLVLERLKNSDIRALNRKLKRAFDIIELSSMSNAVIDNVLMDVDTMDSRFLWVKQEEYDPENVFFPFLNLLRDMLKELGVLRTTINELQVEYVKKVEESEHRVEEEIIQKRALRKQPNPITTTPTPLTWLTNIFYRSTAINNDSKNNTQSHVHNNNSIEPVHFDRGSTLTKTTTITTNSSNSNKSDDVETITPRKEITNNNNNNNNNHNHNHNHNNNTPVKSRSTTTIIPRSTTSGGDKQRRRIPYPTMVTSLSTGTSSTSSPTPIAAILRNKRNIHRTHNNIDYDSAIGPVNILSVPTDRDAEWQGGTLSSSWLGGK